MSRQARVVPHETVRLEVTALGEEVNEAARLEQTAGGGQTLASRALIDRLDHAAARRLELPPPPRYRALAEFGADTNATRDAGTLRVVRLERRRP